MEGTPALRSELVDRVTRQPEALLLGGRGLATEMDRMLVDPLPLQQGTVQNACVASVRSFADS